MQILLYLLKLVKQTKEPDKIAVQETNTISERTFHTFQSYFGILVSLIENQSQNFGVYGKVNHVSLTLLPL